MLQQAVGEPSGGSADIEADLAADIDVPMLQGFLQFESAPADVLQILAQQANLRVRLDGCSCLLYFLAIDQNLAREDQRLRPLARCGDTAFEKKFVEPNLQNSPPLTRISYLQPKCQQRSQCKV